MDLIEIRELAPADIDAAGRLFVEAYPHRAHEVRFWGNENIRERTRRWLAESPAGALLGYAALWHVEQEKYRVDVIVDRPSRRRGIGTRMHDVASAEAARARARTMQARAYEESADAIEFLEHRQYAETMRMHGFELDLARVENAMLSSAASSASSVEFLSPSHADLVEEQFWRKLRELQTRAQEGWPDPDPGGPIEPMTEDALRAMLVPRGEMPLAWFIAVSGGEPAGYSALARIASSPDQAQFIATAVRPDFRGRHIATALRARCLAAAKDAAIVRVRSASGHPAILRSNDAFGFQRRYCEVRLVRRELTP
jgi:GNAT superfamily N-acetyltransferase